MGRRELGPASLEVARAVAAAWPGGECVVGVSGGADSLALAMGAQWAAARAGGQVRAVIVDHGLQPGSADVARRVALTLEDRGIAAEVRRVTLAGRAGGVEAAAREARLAALADVGLPVLLGHTLDDQAEQVLLGIVRGSGTRSLGAMASRRGPFVRPLLGIRRATTAAACTQWGLTPWQDPMNDDDAYMRVRIRHALAQLEAATGRDLAPNLARTAILARADADALDALARMPSEHPTLPLRALEGQPDAIRWRRIRAWLASRGITVGYAHVRAVDALVVAWRGQGPIAVPGGGVERRDDELRLVV